MIVDRAGIMALVIGVVTIGACASSSFSGSSGKRGGDDAVPDRPDPEINENPGETQDPDIPSESDDLPGSITRELVIGGEDQPGNILDAGGNDNNDYFVVFEGEFAVENTTIRSNRDQKIEVTVVKGRLPGGAESTPCTHTITVTSIDESGGSGETMTVATGNGAPVTSSIEFDKGGEMKIQMQSHGWCSTNMTMEQSTSQYFTVHLQRPPELPIQ